MFKKFKKFIKKKLNLSKREKFGLAVGLLTLIFLAIQLISSSFRYPLVGFLLILTYFFCAWGLEEDLKGIEWLTLFIRRKTLFILPVMFVASLSLFYFLLPVRWLTRLPVAVIFALGVYAILLVENIYNVAGERTIQLLRAAHSVGLLLTLFTDFLFLALIFALHLPFYGNTLLIFLISFPLILQALWGMRLEEKITPELMFFTLTLSLAISELALVFSFWPIPTIIEALFLTTVFYSLVSIVQQHFVERLFKRTLWEFISVSVIVFIFVIFTARWGG